MRIIDHPCMIAFDGPRFEPWGFISETYLNDNDDLRASLARFSHSGRFPQVHVLTKDQIGLEPWRLPAHRGPHQRWSTARLHPLGAQRNPRPACP
jgi:hypothetical protein